MFYSLFIFCSYEYSRLAGNPYLSPNRSVMKSTRKSVGRLDGCGDCFEMAVVEGSVHAGAYFHIKSQGIGLGPEFGIGDLVELGIFFIMGEIVSAHDHFQCFDLDFFPGQFGSRLGYFFVIEDSRGSVMPIYIGIDLMEFRIIIDQPI